MDDTLEGSEAEEAQLLRRQFDPLARELGLRGPRVVANTFTVEVIYFADRLGSQVQVEPREFFPFVYVFRHTNDVVPSTYQDAERERMKPSLLQVARKLRLPYDAHLKVQALARSAGSPDAMLEVARDAVRAWWPIFQAREAEIFGP